MPIDVKKIWEWLTLSKTILTLTYCGAFLCLGLLLAGLGPSLPTLGRNTNSPDNRMGATVTSRALGYLAGSTSGPVFHKLPGNKMVAISLIFTSIVCFLVPNLANFYLLCVLFFFQGVSMGMLDTGCNLMTLWLQRENCDPYIQSLHAAFAVGAVISPAVIKAFLSAQMPINYAWYGIGCAFIPFIGLLFYYPSPTEPDSEPTANTQSDKKDVENGSVELETMEEGSENVSTVTAAKKREPSSDFAFSWENRYTVDYKPYLMVLSVAIFLLCYVGGEVATGSFTTTFALRRGLTTEDGGAFLTFLFWLTFAIGRLLAIPLSLFISPKAMLIFDLVGTFISTCFVWSFSSHYTGFAVSLIFYGFFMASTFPSAITLLQTVIPVTGNMTTVFIIGASFGEMLVPLLVSANFESTNYMSLIYVQFASVIAGSIFMIIVGILGFLIVRQREIKQRVLDRVEKLEQDEDTVPLEEDCPDKIDDGNGDEPAENGNNHHHHHHHNSEKMVGLDL